MTTRPSSPVLLASDFPMFRESLKGHVERVSDFKIVACANDEVEVLTLVASHQPELVLIDLNISREAVCTLLDKIHSSSQARTLVIADSVDNTSVIQTLQHGAHGVIARRTTPELFIKSIHSVLAGEYWISGGILSEVMRMLRTTIMPPIVSVVDALESEPSVARAAKPVTAQMDVAVLGLTQRERQIIDALVDGQTNKDIAATLKISEYTVKHHLTNIFDKLGVYNRVELVLYAIHAGLGPKLAVA